MVDFDKDSHVEVTRKSHKVYNYLNTECYTGIMIIDRAYIICYIKKTLSK
jgi:hypothetical protein